MNFWQWLDANPGWAFLYLLLICASLPTIRWSGRKKTPLVGVCKNCGHKNDAPRKDTP